MFTKNNSDLTRTSCALCDGKLIFDTQTDERICSKCGVVMPACDEMLHSTTCMETKNQQQTTTELVTNLMMYELSLPSVIGHRDVDATGKQIKNPQFEKMRRLNRMTFGNDNKTRNMSKAIGEIRRITDILGMKMVVAERATYIYKKAFCQGLIKGRSISGIAAAAIYVACKEMETPHSIEDIEKLVEGLTKKNVMRYYKMLLKCMKINQNLQSPLLYISKISERAGLSGKTERSAVGILSKISTDPLLSGKKPISVAAAALYLAAVNNNEHTTQLRIALTTNLTTITIRKRCSDIIQILKSQAPRLAGKEETTDSENELECLEAIQVPVPN